jgi:hypothetical protein
VTERLRSLPAKQNKLERVVGSSPTRCSILEGLVMSTDVKRIALDLLKDCYEDEIAHLELRIIRDTQAPRFIALKETHPEIYNDFMKARTGPHEVLLRNRRKREETLRAIIEAQNG